METVPLFCSDPSSSCHSALSPAMISPLQWSARGHLRPLRSQLLPLLTSITLLHGSAAALGWWLPSSLHQLCLLMDRRTRLLVPCHVLSLPPRALPALQLLLPPTLNRLVSLSPCFLHHGLALSAPVFWSYRKLLITCSSVNNTFLFLFKLF